MISIIIITYFTLREPSLITYYYILYPQERREEREIINEIKRITRGFHEKIFLCFYLCNILYYIKTKKEDDVIAWYPSQLCATSNIFFYSLSSFPLGWSSIIIWKLLFPLKLLKGLFSFWPILAFFSSFLQLESWQPYHPQPPTCVLIKSKTLSSCKSSVYYLKCRDLNRSLWRDQTPPQSSGLKELLHSSI